MNIKIFKWTDGVKIFWGILILAAGPAGVAQYLQNTPAMARFMALWMAGIAAVSLGVAMGAVVIGVALMKAEDKYDIIDGVNYRRKGKHGK